MASTVIAMTVAAGLVPLPNEPPASAARRRRPNILLVLTDDQPIRTLSVMPKTRRLFRRHGTTFPNAFVTTPLCCPSRATILTGRYAHNHGVKTQDPQGFDPRRSFPRYLKEVGYRTALVGKYLNRWGSSPDYLPVSPPYFDRWATTRPDPDGYYDTTFNVQGSARVVEGYSTRYMARMAVRFLRAFERNDAKPWLLYVGVVAPHRPAIAAPGDEGARIPPWSGNPAVFEDSKEDKPPFVQDARSSFEAGASVRALQLRSLLSVDALVGKVFARLRALGEKRRTLAVFTSDNGFSWGEHGILHKAVPYTRSIRVPLLMRWPGHVPPGRKDRRLTANVDLAPTFLHAARATPRRLKLDGHSLLRHNWRRRHLFIEYFHGDSAPQVPTWRSVRTHRTQYVRYYAASGRVTFAEFYRLRRDPWQLHNVLYDGRRANNPSRRFSARLSRWIHRGKTCKGVACP